ncbi:MAG: biopolymer transporter ExbD [Pyrinomonadaceae bacterium]
MNKPNVNVTPLIDVLLVLLIIFMIVSPLKPSSFKARIPAEPKDVSSHTTNPKALVVAISSDGTLMLNQEKNVGTVEEMSKLVKRLADVFRQRVANGDISESFANEADRPPGDSVERTVFVKARRTQDYGSVARVVDAVKLGGAYPISLQIDDLD